MVDNPSSIPQDAPDDHPVYVRIPDSMIPVYMAIYYAARAWRRLPSDAKGLCIGRLRKRLPKVGNAPSTEEILSGERVPRPMNPENLLSALYELTVFARIQLAGFSATFVGEGLGRAPDIEVHSPRILIECKDSLSALAFGGTDDDAIRKLQDLVADAEDQHATHDPEGTAEHMVLLDLPEELTTRIEEKPRHEQDRFWKRVFGMWHISPDGTASKYDSRIKRPECVLFSDVHLGMYLERKSERFFREPRWFVPFFNFPRKREVACFIEKFLSVNEFVGDLVMPSA